ncbi:MAG: hypothetical protein Ta2B_25890 [Termitinemataceae bacterium]|nr:MAG: hypothetical protein Ta2B_25890 [Termitinemataceae bacterium]
MKLSQELLDQIISVAKEAARQEIAAQFSKNGVHEEGIYSLEQIRECVAPVYVIPYGESSFTCRLKAVWGCEKPKTSLVERSERYKKEPTPENEALLINTMEKYCEITMVCPTFKDFEKITFERCGIDLAEQRKKYKEIVELVKTMDEGAAKEKLQKELESMSGQVGVFLPYNTLQAISFIAEGLDCTDIKKLGEADYLQMYEMAKCFGKAPHEFAHGVFTQAQAEMIDNEAARIGLTAEIDKRKKKHGR